ncbi:hypothetical protein [Salipaludibacillus sp. CF4.18]|uniref:hypothetical protein n=1 Tax=Salipaludibacillus sp. CF4.18 TaxID=3373081 RepID=UPI003EE4A812
MASPKLIVSLIHLTLAAILLHNTYSLDEIQPANIFDSIQSYEIIHDTSFLVELDKLFITVLLALTLALLSTKLVLAIHEYPDWYFRRNRVLFTPVYFGVDYIRVPLSLFAEIKYT